MKYRTTDPTKWGTGQDEDLDAADVDNNFWELVEATQELSTTRPQPNNIASVSRDGTNMVIHLDDGTQLIVPLPVLQYRDRGAWQPNTDYLPLDVFRVEGMGLYSVNLAYTSGTDFDETVLGEGDAPVLNKILGSDAGSGGSSNYDVEFYYPGKLADVTATYLWQMVSLQALLVQSGGHNVAYLQTPATGAITMEVRQNDASVGSIVFTGGANTGSVVLSADVTLHRDDRLSVSPPATADASAAGLTVGFPAVKTA
jgi:hypothetical protein